MTDWQHAAGVAAAERAQSPAGPAPEELGIGAWLAFWVQLVVLGFLAIVGAFFASADAAPGDDVCGLILSVAAVLLAFLRIKRRFDGSPAGWGSFLLVDDTANLVLIVIVFVILGLGGIFVAAAVGEGGLYVGGVALFAVSALAVLLSIKRVFDNLDRGGH
jgi:hypothetical protein